MNDFDSHFCLFLFVLLLFKFRACVAVPTAYNLSHGHFELAKIEIETSMPILLWSHPLIIISVIEMNQFCECTDEQIFCFYKKNVQLKNRWCDTSTFPTIRHFLFSIEWAAQSANLIIIIEIVCKNKCWNYVIDKCVGRSIVQQCV